MQGKVKHLCALYSAILGPKMLCRCSALKTAAQSAKHNTARYLMKDTTALDADVTMMDAESTS